MNPQPMAARPLSVGNKNPALLQFLQHFPARLLLVLIYL